MSDLLGLKVETVRPQLIRPGHDKILGLPDRHAVEILDRVALEDISS